jgi:oligopeptide transport system ATP-binding protein
MSADFLVDIAGLSVSYGRRGPFGGRRQLSVLDGLDLRIQPGETLSVVGESGCGKTTLANALLRLIPITAGRVSFAGVDLARADHVALRRARREMQVVFQNPFGSLNPRLRVIDLVAEPLRTHRPSSRPELRARVAALLAEVGLEEEYLGRFPHQLSGGQAQRVAIARSLALNPRLLILDEPTAALDVSVQAQIINLLRRLQLSHRLTYLFISHDLSVVRHVSDRIAVMYLGRIVELAEASAIFSNPRHPYTKALLAATPQYDPDGPRESTRLKGAIPSIAQPPPGCPFHPRCPVAVDLCRTVVPVPEATADGGSVSCHLATRC